MFARSLGPAVALVAAVASVPLHAGEATLAAGAGFRRPLTELADRYAQASGDRILQVYGHLGQIVAQARASEEIGLLCGDRAVIEKAEGLSFSRWVPLGNGKLVVAFRNGLTLAAAEEVARPDLARIGIPDQASAVYGKAGRQFLDRSGLAAEVDPRLVPVGTVPQVTSYVASGDLDAGFVNATDAIGAGDGIGGFVEVPAEFYDPVAIACGMRTGADNPDLTGFVDFLETPEAREVLDRYGL